MAGNVNFEEITALAERGLKLWKESPLHVRQREQCRIMGALAKAWLQLKKEVEEDDKEVHVVEM
jgi:hypothetical protein